VQKIVLERPETRRAAEKPKQNTRRPRGGGKDPKQCPSVERAVGTEVQEEMASTLTAAIADVQIKPKRLPKIGKCVWFAAKCVSGLLPQME
jgi:hypothetical protein